MKPSSIALLVMGGLCLAQAGCSGGHSGQAGAGLTARDGAGESPGSDLPPPPRSQKRKADDICTKAYRTLKCGGGMYAGTVVSVAAEGSDRSGEACEWGTIGFRVARTIAGPPQQEMTVRYFYWLNDDLRAQGIPALDVAADIGGSASQWSARPKAGERLLLLLADEYLAAQIYSEKYGNVYYRWEVNPDDPLVDGFAVAGQFLTAKDEAPRDDLYRQLCQSPLPEIEHFAWAAAFAPGPWLVPDRNARPSGTSLRGGEYDGVRQSHLVQLYLKYVGRRLRPGDRLGVTAGFSGWFAYRLRGASEDVRGEFEDWYITELSVRDDMRRPRMALRGLKEIVRGNGEATTIGLFKKAGRDGLLDRLRDCARSGDSEVEKLSKALLARLDPP